MFGKLTKNTIKDFKIGDIVVLTFSYKCTSNIGAKGRIIRFFYNYVLVDWFDQYKNTGLKNYTEIEPSRLAFDHQFFSIFDEQKFCKKKKKKKIFGKLTKNTIKDFKIGDICYLTQSSVGYSSVGAKGRVSKILESYIEVDWFACYSGAKFFGYVKPNCLALEHQFNYMLDK